MFRSTRSGNLDEAGSIKMNSNIEDRSSGYGRESKRGATVLDATVDENAETSNTVLKTTVHAPNDGTVFDITVSDDISKDLSTVSHPKFTKIMEDDMAMLCSVMKQQNVTSCKEETTDSLIDKALPGARNYKVKISV